jgi:hypothetical protein
MTWTNLSDCLVQIAISEDNERGLPPELQRDPLGIAFSSTEEMEGGGSVAVSKYYIAPLFSCVTVVLKQFKELESIYM